MPFSLSGVDPKFMVTPHLPGEPECVPGAGARTGGGRGSHTSALKNRYRRPELACARGCSSLGVRKLLLLRKGGKVQRDDITECDRGSLF